MIMAIGQRTHAQLLGPAVLTTFPAAAGAIWQLKTSRYLEGISKAGLTYRMCQVAEQAVLEPQSEQDTV